MDKVNYPFEEYKMLKEESRTYTDVNFRDLQVLITLIAAFLVLISSSPGKDFFWNFWYFALAQFVVFVFLLIQLSRVAYILLLRQYLSELESILNKDKDNILRWESKIVPSRVASSGSLNSQGQILISITYFVLFCFLFIHSISLSNQLVPNLLYYILLAFEAGSLSYLFIRIILKKI
jgi:hypothetical protein